MSTEFQYDVFLSHNQADKPRVRRLAERRNTKAEGRMQNAELLPSAFSILPSPLVWLERSTVLFRDPANAGRRFTPFLLPRDKSLTRRRKNGEYSHYGNSSFQRN